MFHRLAVRPCRAGLLMALLAAMAACSEPPAESSAAVSTAPITTQPVSAPSAESTQARTQRLWAASCALCHVDGNGGAPRLGYADEWAPRVAQGADALLHNTLQGVGNMPPLGYCMACDRDDFNRLIAFMAGTQHE